MKPHNFKKLTKKELRKAYVLQWKHNIFMKTENERLQELLYIADDHLSICEEQLADTIEALDRRRQLNASLEEQLQREKAKNTLLNK